MKLPHIVVGAGGHATVVADALLTAGLPVLGFVDADSARHGRTLCGLPVLGGDAALDAYSPDAVMLVNGIGGVGKRVGESLRATVQRTLSARGWRFVQLRHPTATVSSFAHLHEGVQVLAASVVQAGASIGSGCIVNTGAIVEHDVVLGDWVHVAPGAVVCGDVTIGARSHVGAGAVVRQGVRLGADTIVGAGAVVVASFDGGLLVGVPARRLDHDL